MIPFQPWLPDRAAFPNTTSTDVRNVIPSETGFRPFPALSAVATALGARPQGAISVRSQTGSITSFCGTADKLYKLNSDGLGWTDVSRTTGGAYSTSDDGWWDFSLFGDYVIATNKVDDVQYFDLTGGTNFAALAGTPSKAAFTGVIRDFSVLARLDGSESSMQWSAINDPEDWVASTLTMSDSQYFPDGGAITGFVGGEYGVVFQEKAIQRMSFEGPPVIFRFDKVATSIGCRVERSIAAYAGMIFFLSDDGFYMLQGGSELTPIGQGKIDKWCETNINQSATYRISSAIDPINKLYFISIPTSGTSCDPHLTSHWPTGPWSKAPIGDHDFIYSAATQSSVTIDGLDAFSSTIDGLPFPVDSRFYSGTGRLLLAGFNSSHSFGFFQGSNMEARLETGESQFKTGRRSLVRGARPLVEGSFSIDTAYVDAGYDEGDYFEDIPAVVPKVSVGYRDILNDTVTYTTDRGVTPLGYSPLRANARYIRFRLTIPAGLSWTLATGIDDIAYSVMGAR